MKIFFGGSRRVSQLSPAIIQRANNIMNNGYTVLIGDANGADKSMQSYLAQHDYKNVIVYCMGNQCRNNIGKWQTRNILSDRIKKDFQYFATKDYEMSQEAEFGFMLWDGKSKGTLNNMLNLLNQKKQVLVYFSPEKLFYTIRNNDNLITLLGRCEKTSRKSFETSLNLSNRISEFSFAS